MEKYLTSSEIIARFQISRSLFYRLIKNQQFPRPAMVGGARRYAESAVISWIEKQRQKGNDKKNTGDMFSFITSENGVIGEYFGLHWQIGEQMAGHAGQNNSTKEEYVRDVLSQAEYWKEAIDLIIGGLNKKEDADDIKILRSIRAWKYDEAEMGRLAHEDWEEMGGAI